MSALSGLFNFSFRYSQTWLVILLFATATSAQVTENDTLSQSTNGQTFGLDITNSHLEALEKLNHLLDGYTIDETLNLLQGSSQALFNNIQNDIDYEVQRESAVTNSAPLNPGIRTIQDSNSVLDFLRSQRIRLRAAQDFNFLNNGLRFYVRYNYMVDPAYDGKNFIRLDSYTGEYAIDPLRLLKIVNVDSPLYLQRVKHYEVQFIRNYPEYKQALMAIPQWPQNAPLKVDNIVNHIKPGDYATFHTRLNVAVGIKYVAPIEKYFQVTAGTHLVVSGNFRINVYRVDEKTVRLKFILVHGDNKNLVDLSLGINPEYKIFTGVMGNQLTGLTENLLDLDTLAFYRPFIKDLSHVFTQIYEIDTSNPEGKMTLDNVFKQILKSGALESDLIEPLQRKAAEKLGRIFTVTLDPLLEKALTPETSGIFNSYVLNNVIKRESEEYGFNIIAMKQANTSNYTETYAEVEKVSESNMPTLQNYLLSSWSQLTVRNVVFGIVDRVRILKSANAIYQTDKRRNVIRFLDLGFSYEGHEQTLTVDDQTEIRNNLKKLLPDYIYSIIDWGDFGGDYSMRHQTSSRIRYDYFFNEKGYKAARENILNALGINDSDLDNNAELDQKIVSYIEQVLKNKIQQIQAKYKPIYISNNSITKIATQLKKALFAKEPKEAVDSFHSLRKVDAFVEFGPSFLIALLPNDRLSEYFNFTLTGTAQNFKKDAFAQFGSNENMPLYNEIRCLNSIARDDAYDFRIRCDFQREKRGP